VREALNKDQRQFELTRKALSYKKSMQHLSLHVCGFNLTPTSADDLTLYFRAFGDVKSVKVTPTGAALVSFGDRETARRAKEMSHGADFDGKLLSVDFFEPREVREIQKLEENDKKACDFKRQRDFLGVGPLGAIDTNISGILNALGALLGFGANQNSNQGTFNNYNNGGMGQQRQQ
jgi:RNA recognition motif-containing protein